LGVLLLSILFSYFAITKLDFFRRRRKWPAITLFLALLGGLAYGLAFFIQATATALPGIAEKSVPAIIQWAGEHHIRLPFTDFESLKDEALKIAANEAKNIGRFADFARGATTQFVYLVVGCVVAMGLFLNPLLELDRPASADRNNLYSRTCAEISRRFATFYHSFAMVMSAQVIIAAIDAVLTGIFLTVTGLPHVVVAVGVTFLCGLLPVVGNLLSNTLVVAIGFTISPAKGLGALVFLVCIHQLEYFLNSKIIGGKIRSPLWLTLLALVLGESLMGITGMILAPAVLHYIRIEASAVSVNSKQK
jgi:predicted PurR-regulated permease PerM